MTELRSLRSHNVLAILEAEDGSEAPTLTNALSLLSPSRSKLTLVRVCDPGRVFRWFGGDFYLPDGDDADAIAARHLRRIATTVPDDVTLTTLALSQRVGPRLRALIRTGNFDAIVASEARLRRLDPDRRGRARTSVRILGPVATEIRSAAVPDPVALSR